jgi:MFS family permease
LTADDTEAVAGRMREAAPVAEVAAPGKERWSQVAVLGAGQLLAGVGVASGISVGGVLAEQLSGSTAMAGMAQTCSILGAGAAALPLASLARARGRRVALTLGYAIALAGVVLVLIAVVTPLFPLYLVGMGLFGAATAAGLQSRFAAAEGVSPARSSRAISLVLWATTVGSVAGPNLSQAGSEWGASLGIEPLVGPYLFTAVGFAAAALAIGLLLRPTPASPSPTPRERSAKSPGAWRAGVKVPQVRLGVALTVTSHMVMVGVMVMTPVHMHHLGFGLDAVGIVLSIHIFGMYGASPLLGWVADRFGEAVLGVVCVVVFACSLTLGATWGAHDMYANTVALGLLGIGWSAGVIAGSSLIAKHCPQEQRFAVQGGTDALMNFGAAVSAAAAGSLIAFGGVAILNLVAAVVLLPVVVGGAVSWARRGPRAPLPHIDSQAHFEKTASIGASGDREGRE